MRNIPMFLLFTALLGACSGGSNGPGQGAGATKGITPVAKQDVGEVLARVGDSVVGSEEFKHEAARKTPASGAELSDEERLEVLDELVTEEVLFQEAMKKGLYQDSKVRKILVNLLLREEVYAGVKNDDFTEEELMAYYEDHKDEFIVPEKVQVKRIYIRTGPDRDDAAAKALADKVHTDLMKDRRVFSELAATHSDGPYKRRGGDIGFISREGKPGIDDEVVAKAFEMKIDEISAPFKSGDGYHILYVVNRRDRVERTFEQMKGSVVRMVKQDRYKKLTDDYIAKAKGGYTVEIDQAKVKAVEIGRGGARFASPEIDPDAEAPGDEIHP
ncbi:MAG: peptidylprolyl isomerase [Alphaproteobacteria bacterium]|nr:peptidylprolyl isomerase [Alphaproteobacteria bacterium]